MAAATTTPAAAPKSYANRASDTQYQAFLKWDAEKSPGSPYTTPGSPFYDTQEQYDSLQKYGYPKQFLSESGGVSTGGGGGTGNPGVAIPEPTVSAASAYGSASNQSATVATNTDAQSLSGPESANPSLGKRIYPQHMRALAALSPRVY